MCEFYRFGDLYSYTPDIEVKKKDNKYGIIYLPTGETLLPFEYENILINGYAVNNFFVVKNGLYGAVHLDGKHDSANDLFTEKSDLVPYGEKPKLIYDVPCEYDYFVKKPCNDFIFYSNAENVYLNTALQNTVICFEETKENYASVWGRKDGFLYLVQSGEIQYTEPFNGFRFKWTHDRYEFFDYEKKQGLMCHTVEGNDDFFTRYILVRDEDYTSCGQTVPLPSTLNFNGKIIEFEYYSEKFAAISSISRLSYETELFGICEKTGIRITLPFAHTLLYIGKNRFIANCENGKFGLCEIKYRGNIKNKHKNENQYDLFPEFLLDGYDYVNYAGGNIYEFRSNDRSHIRFNAKTGRTEDDPFSEEK